MPRTILSVLMILVLFHQPKKVSNSPLHKRDFPPVVSRVTTLLHQLVPIVAPNFGVDHFFKLQFKTAPKKSSELKKRFKFRSLKKTHMFCTPNFGDLLSKWFLNLSQPFAVDFSMPHPKNGGLPIFSNNILYGVIHGEKVCVQFRGDLLLILFTPNIFPVSLLSSLSVRQAHLRRFHHPGVEQGIVMKAQIIAKPPERWTNKTKHRKGRWRVVDIFDKSGWMKKYGPSWNIGPF